MYLFIYVCSSTRLYSSLHPVLNSNTCIHIIKMLHLLHTVIKYIYIIFSKPLMKMNGEQVLCKPIGFFFLNLMCSHCLFNDTDIE